MVSRILLLASIVILSVGCSSTPDKERIIPKSDDTMKDIYINGGRVSNGSQSHDEVFNKSRAELLNRGAMGTPQDLNVYRLNKVTNQGNFSKLHNPTLYLYFPPKISETDRLPIPAMMTEFKMYDKDEYVFGERFAGEH